MQSAGSVQHVKNGVLYRAREVWIRAYGRLPKGEIRKAGKDDQAAIDTHYITTKCTNLTNAQNKRSARRVSDFAKNKRGGHLFLADAAMDQLAYARAAVRTTP